MIDLRNVLSAIKPYVLGWIYSYMNISARVYNNANISVPNTTWTPLTFNSERWDTDNIHSTVTNTGLLTCTQAGKYLIGGVVSWATNTTGARGIALRLNGTTWISVITMSADIFNSTHELSTIYNLAVGDYVDMMVFQSSGAALNLTVNGNFSPEFWMQRVS